MKGKTQWYNSYKVSLRHFAFQLSALTIILIMWTQIWFVISGQNMVGTGRLPSASTYIINLKYKD